MKDPKFKMPETDDGNIIFNVPLPDDLSKIKGMAPIIIKQPYKIDYIHSYGQDSPFFAALANGKMLGTRCPKCGYTYATPKGHCEWDGTETEWIELPKEGRVHTWTTCFFGSEEFLPETPFNLVLVEFDGADTLFLARLLGAETQDISVGMKIRPKFKRNSKFKPTDVYFVPVADEKPKRKTAKKAAVRNAAAKPVTKTESASKPSATKKTVKKVTAKKTVTKSAKSSKPVPKKASVKKTPAKKK